MVLYDSPVKREVEITIMKYTEPEFAVCGIRYIQTDSVELLTHPAPKKRCMQIIGDSITCGHGVERLELKTSEENHVKAYSVIAAQELDAVNTTLMKHRKNGNYGNIAVLSQI